MTAEESRRGDGEEDGPWEQMLQQQQQPQQELASQVEVDMAVDDPDFDLEKAVCSHGLFMMAPNRWDPSTRTFQRPLRLQSVSSTLSVFIRVSQPRPESSSLRVSVFGVDSLSLPHQQSLLAQIRRMLRFNKQDEQAVIEFHKIHSFAKERGFGRVFRSPTLFEDMIKCILLCNCQWSRTLSMARALCELQSELKDGVPFVKDLQPRTPQKKEPRRKNTSFQEEDDESSTKIAFLGNPSETHLQNPKRKRSDSGYNHKCRQILGLIGNFPSPEELAGLKEDHLARRCNLGYRAKRILSLAQAVVEKKIHLDELEELCDVKDPSSYEMLNEKLSSLDGFGPFTRANVLVCMGFYHKIPSDSETIRHLRQVHSLRCSNTRVVDNHVEEIYGKFAPFQFLAYMSELWHFYEQRFGKMSEMVYSDYQRITASNMKDHLNGRRVKMRTT